MVPTRFIAYGKMLPWLGDVVEWSQLRKWSLSEVYRARLKTGESRIVKWGGGEMAEEADIYRELVRPLQIKAPRIYCDVRGEDGGVIVMEDAGDSNLEQRPEPQLFLEAARELARWRARAAVALDAALPDMAKKRHFVSGSDFLGLLDDLLQSERVADKKSVLAQIRSTLPEHLERLYETVPVTLVHHDYHAKNLLVRQNGVMAIDWSLAYLSPHLGDLYCLVAEAHAWSGSRPEDVMAAFREEAGDGGDGLIWQMRVGGLCWLIKTLRWIAYGGTRIIPESEGWIPDLLLDMEQIYGELA